eukprot:5262974-Pyramimonas_sp.AAC.1
MARHMHLIITKVALYCREGIAHAGSRMTCSWEGKGSDEQLDNQRSTTLANAVITHHYRYLRQCLRDAMPSIFFSTQMSGRQHCSAFFNHLA